MPEQFTHVEGRRKRPLQVGLIAGLVAAALLLAACGASQAEAIPTSPTAAVPQPPPTAVVHRGLDAAPLPPLPRLPAADFRLPDLEGNTYTLSQFRGKPVMLFFWATW